MRARLFEGDVKAGVDSLDPGLRRDDERKHPVRPYILGGDAIGLSSVVIAACRGILHTALSPYESTPLAGRPKRIALVAGEASGDLLGAGLIAELRKRFPDAEFAGIGGDQMRAAGFDSWHDASELAVMGLAEVLRHLPRLLRLRREFRERLLAWQPDVFVGIDAPDFNLGVERWAASDRGVRTVHYVSPSVWAWREKRAEKIGRSADRVLCLFPMEPAIYARHGVDARFVGHPLADEMPLDPDRDAARRQLGLDPQTPACSRCCPARASARSSASAPIFLAAASQLIAARSRRCRSSCRWRTRARTRPSSACSRRIRTASR